MPDDTSLENTLGVDTHSDTHTAVIIDHLGRVLDTLETTADPDGYQHLIKWARSHGPLGRAGVEGTASYGAGLTYFLRDHDVDVIEVNRPNRQRRRRGKSDPTDAEAAARAVLAGDATATPKTKAGVVESIRVLRLTRSSAVKTSTQVANQIKDLVVSAPEPLRSELRAASTTKRVAIAARYQPGDSLDPLEATRRALRSLALRHQTLAAEIRDLERELTILLRQAAPRLLAEPGVGAESAAKLLITAGDNGHRLTTDAALAALCGANPVEASSGKVTRHRLNRGGDRQANNALWTIAFNRLHHHDETRVYAQWRTTEGKSQREIIRCLKRSLARRLHPLLLADLADAAKLTANPH